MSRIDQPGEGSQKSSGTEQVRESAAEVKENLRDLGSQARAAAQEQYDQLRQQANDYYEQGRVRAQEWEQGVEDYIREQPVKSMLIAAGVGLLLGALWKRG